MKHNPKQKNSGFSLVEVVVSMLVLSIVVVSVLSAFTTSAKVNNKSKEAQNATSLLEDVEEYVKAGGIKDVNAYCDHQEAGETSGLDVFNIYGATSISRVKPAPGSTDHVTTYTLTNVAKGFNAYTIEIKEDTDPDRLKKAGMNEYEQISLGDANNASTLFDVAGIASYDEQVLNIFRQYHLNYLDACNDEIDNPGDYYTKPTFTGSDCKFLDVTKGKNTKFTAADTAMISREIILKVNAPAASKMEVEVLLRYILDDRVAVEDEDGDGSTDNEHQYDYELYKSIRFDDYTVTDEDAMHLENIYLLYAPSMLTGNANGTDIRVIGDTSKLSANLFVVYQEEVTSLIDAADVANKTLQQRMAGKGTVHVFCESAPNRLDCFCSTKIAKAGGASAFGSVSFTDNNLISTKKSVRAHDFVITIKDASGNVIRQGEASCSVK